MITDLRIVKYLITMKTLTITKLRRNRQNFEIFFVKFQAPFSQKSINIHLYIPYKGFIHSIVWLWWPPNDIYFNNESPPWKTVLFVETTKLFTSNSVRVYGYICEIFWLYVPGVGLLTPCSVPRGGVLYTVIVLGVCSLQVVSRAFVPGGGGGLDVIDTYIICLRRNQCKRCLNGYRSYQLSLDFRLFMNFPQVSRSSRELTKGRILVHELVFERVLGKCMWCHFIA